MQNKAQWKAQRIKVFEYLKENVATASMVTNATNIPQKCVTSHKRTLQISGLLWEVEKKHCKLTGHRAAYLTTNENLIPAPQPTLFKDGQ